MKTVKMIIAVLLFLAVFPPVHAREKTGTMIVLNTANDPPNSTEEHTGIGDRVLTEAFRRLGMSLTIVNLPSERALMNANQGIDDGNFARVEGLDKIYTGLIQVPEDITKFEFVVFTKTLDFNPAGWGSLKPYNVGIIIGWKILENSIGETKSLIKVKDEDLLFKMLETDRVDLIVYDRVQGLALMKKANLRNVRILSPPLAVRPMYPYLHRRHKDLVPKLADAIRAMKADGTYQRIVADVLRDVLGQQ